MKIWFALALLLTLAGLLCADAMPDFRLPNEKDKNVSLSDLLGKGPVLIDFWADYCQPCKQAMPALNDLALRYDSLTVVLVSIDAAKMQPKAKSYLNGKKFSFVTLFDPDKTLAKKLNVVNPPHTFILDKTGEIVWSHVGYEPGMEASYEEQIRLLLALDTPPDTEVEPLPEGKPCHE